MANIRECTPGDFEQILPLLQQLWPQKALCQDRLRLVFERGLASDAQTYLCAVEGDHIVGFCSMTIKNNLWQEGFLAHLDELVVNRAHRGCGLGSQLLEAMILLAKERGCARVELDSAFHRTEAHAFYERQGFENRAYLFSKPLI